MRIVIIEDFNGYISLVTDPNTGEVKVFDIMKDAQEEAKNCQNGKVVILSSEAEVNSPKYCCSECGGTNVQVLAWVDANTNQYISDADSWDDCWCEDCCKHVNLTDI